MEATRSPAKGEKCSDDGCDGSSFLHVCGVRNGIYERGIGDEIRVGTIENGMGVDPRGGDVVGMVVG